MVHGGEKPDCGVQLQKTGSPSATGRVHADSRPKCEEAKKVCRKKVIRTRIFVARRWPPKMIVKDKKHQSDG